MGCDVKCKMAVSDVGGEWSSSRGLQRDASPKSCCCIPPWYRVVAPLSQCIPLRAITRYLSEIWMKYENISFEFTAVASVRVIYYRPFPANFWADISLIGSGNPSCLSFTGAWNWPTAALNWEWWSSLTCFLIILHPFVPHVPPLTPLAPSKDVGGWWPLTPRRGADSGAVTSFCQCNPSVVGSHRGAVLSRRPTGLAAAQRGATESSVVGEGSVWPHRTIRHQPWRSHRYDTDKMIKRGQISELFW